MKKKPLPPAINLAASLSALAALGSAILGKVDPVTCLVRGVIAFFCARVLAGFWFAVFVPHREEEQGQPEPEPTVDDLAEGQEQVAA